MDGKVGCDGLCEFCDFEVLYDDGVDIGFGVCVDGGFDVGEFGIFVMCMV